MGLSANDPRPKQRQIADDIRQRIIVGELTAGDRVSSTRELMAHYGVSNQTVQTALKILQAEQLTEGVPGRGTFVRSGIDLEAISHDDRSGAPSADYVALSKKLDGLAEAVRAVEGRLADIEADRAKPSKKPARRS